ncbi:MAG: glycosyltransferase family 4 protein [Longimicrobiales bacterium]
MSVTTTGGASAGTPRALRVLLIHQLFVLGREAGGTRHVELARHLVRRGHEVTVVASPISYLTGERHAPVDEGAEEGLTLLRTWTYRPRSSGFVARVLSFLSFSTSSAVAALFRVPSVDVVWGTSPPLFQAAAAVMVARLRRVPFVLEVRDLWPDFAVELGVLRNPLVIRLARWLERFVYDHADEVVVNSPGFVGHLEARGVDPSRITLVPNGVEVSDFDPDARGQAFVRELGLDPARHRLVVYTGAHGIPNDLDVLLDAAHRLRHRADARFVLVGGGRDKDRLEARARDRRLDNVVFVAPQPKERMPEILAAASVCVAHLKPIPLFDTTYPNKVFDYMAAGRPTVLGIDGVIRRVVEDADGGCWVQPGDPAAMARAVAGYLDDPEAAEAAGRRARAYVAEHFDREDQAETLRGVLERAGRGR